MSKITWKIGLGVGIIMIIILLVLYSIAIYCAYSSKSQAPTCQKMQSTALHYTFAFIIICLISVMIFFRKMGEINKYIIVSVLFLVSMIWNIIILTANNTSCPPDHPSHPVCQNSSPNKGINICAGIFLSLSVVLFVIIIVKLGIELNTERHYSTSL